MPPLFLPMMPCGRNSSTSTRMANANMLLADGVNSSPAIASVTPIKHAAEQRARHRAQAAGDDDDEGEQRIGRPERRRDVDDQHQHAAGGADAGRAEAEGQRIEVLDVEPDHQRAGVVVGAGADRLAGPRVLEEPEQRGRDHDRGEAGIELGRVDDQRADRETVESRRRSGRFARPGRTRSAAR